MARLRVPAPLTPGGDPDFRIVSAEQGGGARGYAEAGFEVVGVDIEPQPHYPYEFIQADAMTYPLDGFDAVHASPPCHDHSSLRHHTGRDHGTGWMLAATLEEFADLSIPWVVENVEGADLGGSWFTLCGSQFGLGVRRHRRFASSEFILTPPCNHREQGPIQSVYGHAGGSSVRDGRSFGGVAEWRSAMGIDWMTGDELAQAIPPAYTRFIGEHLMARLLG